VSTTARVSTRAGTPHAWPLPPLAGRTVGSAVLASVAVLVATSARYDYHRDELYFRMLRPAWGYVDQPPLTPLLARAATAAFDDTVWAMRIPATLCVAAAILLTALTTRELGGGRGAQGLCAWGYAFATVPLVFGHILLTATVDLAIWAAVILLVVRALLRDARPWWLAVGVLVGLALYNKYLILLLLLGLAIGLITVGPRRVLRSGWLWAGGALALLIGSPNLVYQAMNDWPQITMAGAMSENTGEQTRLLWPFQLLILGLPLVPIWISGFVALLRRPAWRPLRALAVAYPVVLLVTFVGGGQVYYPVGVIAFLFAAGCVVTAEWISVHRAWRRPLVIAGLALNAAVTLVLALPLLPVDVLGRTPIPELNQGTRDQIGWPSYTRQVADVYRALPPTERSRAVVITGNYGEAGALARYGGGHGLPAIYSGQNELYFYGPPPESATVAVTMGLSLTHVKQRFEFCDEAGRLDNGVGVDNEEQGRLIAVCRNPVGGWGAAWPRFQHYD
jgi:hypothetical protein